MQGPRGRHAPRPLQGGTSSQIQAEPDGGKNAGGGGGEGGAAVEDLRPVKGDNDAIEGPRVQLLSEVRPAQLRPARYVPEVAGGSRGKDDRGSSATIRA